MGRRRRRASKARWIGAAAVAAVLIAAVLVQVTRGGSGSAASPSGAVSALDGASGSASPSGSATATSSPTPTATITPAPTPSATPTIAHTTAAPAAKSTPAPAGYRQITIVNAVNQTVWAAINQNAQYPLPVSGWKLDPGQSVTFAVPQAWGGRVWGRTGCDFNSSGVGHCQTGDCGNVFQCKGTGATPATLAELTLDSYDGLDFYDVSMVDGSNLPMYINTTHRSDADPISADGCYQGTCTTAVQCPSAMVVDGGAACETACAAFGTDDYCCRGSWSGRAACDPAKWPVDYAKIVWKDAEPYAYSYAYDDSATMACKGGCNYKITFGITS